MVLLQKQEDKLVLKQQGTQLVAGQDDKKRHSPLLWLNNVLARNDATGMVNYHINPMKCSEGPLCFTKRGII